MAPDNVSPIPGSAYSALAKRPKNSRLDTTKLKSTFNLVLPDWQIGANRLLDELMECQKIL
jgi:dTDP-4-dehydrorhamnose reductase